MIDLQECRNEIDKIDSDIIRLFEQRMQAVSYTHLTLPTT